MAFRHTCVGLLFALVLSGSASAGLAEIRRDKLPQDAPVQKAFSDVSGVEDSVRTWSADWHGRMPKKDAVAVLTASLDQLQKQLKTSPDNLELLLLTGLVAHYAYNADVESAFDVAVSSFTRAHELVPDDYRSDWFLAVHRCEADQVPEGMEVLLKIERDHDRDQMPVNFWDDYINCALIASLPAHVLRAGETLRATKAPPSRERDEFLELAHERFKQPDPSAIYPGREAWISRQTGSEFTFTGTMFGISFTIPGNWSLDLSDVQKSFGMVQIGAGPYAGKAGKVTPTIVIISRPAEPGETLDSLLAQASNGVPGNKISTSACPSTECVAFAGTRIGGYKAEGDAHLLLTAFERSSPDFPGLLFEQPLAIPKTPENGQPAAFTAPEVLHRLDGKLYYLVVLDTADSVFTDATSAYEQVLKGIVVE